MGIHGQGEISRWNRVSNGDQWTNMMPAYKNKLEWPLMIKLHNNPIDDSFVYQCILNDIILKTEFEESFDGNQEIDIYSIHVEHIIKYAENESNITYDSNITTTNNITNIATTHILSTDSVESTVFDDTISTDSTVR